MDYESESDRDLNYNDADILTNEQMDRRDGVAVRASASQLVDLGFIP